MGGGREGGVKPKESASSTRNLYLKPNEIIFRNQIIPAPFNHLKEHEFCYQYDHQIINLERRGYFVSATRNNGVCIAGHGIYITSQSSAESIFIADEVLNGMYDFQNCGNEFVVIDIGMNIGCAALKFAQYDWVRKIYGFEPFATTFDEAELNLKINPKLAEKIAIFDFGLLDVDKEISVRFNHKRHSMMSVCRDFFSTDAHLPVEKVRVRNAVDVVREIIERHNEKIMLKIDCEGSEHAIVPALDAAGLLEKVSIVIMKYHFGKSDELVKILERNGFAIEIRDVREDIGTGMIRGTKLNCV
jgi:FkbM family methyltransferase